jgi:hypothetical protein
MRTTALLLAILMGTTAVSAVNAAPKKHKAPAAAAQPEDLNANGKKLVMDGLPLIMPSAVMFWMLHNKEVEAKDAAAKKASMKHHRAVKSDKAKQI